MIRLKNGVSVKGIHPTANLIITIVNSVYASHGENCTVTSVTDGVHSDGSLHYSGKAVDFRTRNLVGGYRGQLAKEIAEEIREALGDDFDVVLEADHIHVEFDTVYRGES